MLVLNNVNVLFKSENQERFVGTSYDHVLHNVSFEIKPGQCLGILGESGSGKSTIGRVLSGMLKPQSGFVLFKGQEVYGSGLRTLTKTKGMRDLKSCISVVFQDYTTSTNPRFKIKDILSEGLAVARKKDGSHSGTETLEKTTTHEGLMELVGLDCDLLKRYPHELSGGQLQRVCIARALACQPQIILFDEAISSLDAHTQVQVMDLLHVLKSQLDLTYVFITHDLSSITYLCDEVIFLKDGHITESCAVSELWKTTDEYAHQLLHSMIDIYEVEKGDDKLISKVHCETV